jgi:hypothetical protein
MFINRYNKSQLVLDPTQKTTHNIVGIDSLDGFGDGGREGGRERGREGEREREAMWACVLEITVEFSFGCKLCGGKVVPYLTKSNHRI